MARAQGATWQPTGALGVAQCLHPNAPRGRKAVPNAAQLECGAASWLIENAVAQLAVCPHHASALGASRPYR